MQQIVSITDARNNLSELFDKVVKQGVQIVVVRDSEPGIVFSPYSKIFNDEETKEKLFKMQFDRLLREGKKTGRAWAKKKGLDLKKLSEEEIYDLIDKI